MIFSSILLSRLYTFPIWHNYVVAKTRNMQRFQRLFGFHQVSARHCKVLCSQWGYVGDTSAQTHPYVTKVFNGIISGERAALAKGITLVESLNQRKKAMGRPVFYFLLQCLLLQCFLLIGCLLLVLILYYSGLINYMHQTYNFLIIVSHISFGKSLDTGWM